MKLRSQRRLAGALSLGAMLVMAGCAGLGMGSQERTVTLFDGTSLDGWEQAGPGRFALQPDGSIVSEGGMGLLYYAERPFRDYVLELEWKAERDSVNSGIFLRFPEKSDDPWTAVRTGYEIQIDPTAKNPINRTGAIYDIAAPFKDAAKPAGEWNQYRIEVTGQRYQVYLNGEKVNDFFGDRGREGYIGLQNHDPNSPVAFRNIRVTPVQAEDAPESLAELFEVEEQRAPIRVLVLTATTGWRHKEAIEATKQVLPKLDQTTEFDFTITEDVSALNEQNLAQYDLIFLANSTIRVAERDNQDERGMKPGGNHNEPAPALTEAQEQALLNFVRSGKGLVVAHSALDALYGSSGYTEAVGGGLFESHPWTQPVGIRVEDRTSPATAHLGEGFNIRDEIYVLDKNPRWNSHVLLSLDMRSVQGDSMSADPTRDDYPISWLRRYGQGRVFATKLGHFADVWNNPAFLEHLLQGMRIAAGRVEADFGGRRVKETIATNVWPDDIAVDERGNVWIAELTGKIHRYDAQTKQTALVAEINTTIPRNIEHGLYGVEVDPNFYGGEPYVYAFYAEPESFVNTLSRFEFRNGQIDMSTEEVLLRVPTDPQCCHQAGDLEWGPDGTLFVSTGDTGQSGTKPDQEISEARINAFVERNELTGYHWSRLADSERTAQNLQDLRGKVLRINKDGSIPKSNPFYGQPGVRWEIYAYGLRNPYRIKYDAPTDRLFIGIVGPDEQTTYDWYNVSTKGGENFGWPRATGRLFYNEWTPEMIPGYVPPIWEYTYATGGRSATMGPIYRHQGEGGFPDVFQNKAFVYDWSRKWIKWGDVVENATFMNDTISDVKAAEHVVRIPAIRLQNVKTFDVLEEGTSPISMELGPDGCLYLAEFTGFWEAAPGSLVSRYCWREDAAPDSGAQGR
jgi:cytochrome c